MLVPTPQNCSRPAMDGLVTGPWMSILYVLGAVQGVFLAAVLANQPKLFSGGNSCQEVRDQPVRVTLY